MQSTVRRTSGQNQPVEYEMNAVVAFSRSLVRREQFRSGGCAETAIARVARRLKTGPGTLSNIIRKRVKSVCFMLGQRIVAAAISDLEQEQKRLEAERDLLLDMGPNPDPALLDAADAALEQARANIEKMRGGR